MKQLDGRKNAMVRVQDMIEMRYIDNTTITQQIKNWGIGRHVIYAFSGMSLNGQVRIDINPNSNATLNMDVFEWLEKAKLGCADMIVIDAPFVLYNAPGINYSVWEKAIKDGLIPESMKKSKYWGHPNEWQRAFWNLLEPGGLLVMKRPIVNINVLSKLPVLYYVHDSRPSAVIVRLDQK